jgi:LacI family transcriptional regulator
MATGRSHSVALVVSDVRNPFFAEVARGAEDAAYGAGCDLILCNSDLDASKQMRYIRSLADKQVDGIVMNSTAPLSNAERKELANYDIPIVVLNRVAGAQGFSSVCSDNQRGGALAAEHLAALGHRKVVQISGPDFQGNLRERTVGFRQRFEELTGQAPETITGEHSQAGGYAMIKDLLASGKSFSAVFAANDVMAYGTIRACAEHGVSIPGDVSLVGFDDLDLSAIVNPALTTVRQAKYEMGKAALEIILARVGKNDKQEPEHRVLDVELIVRGSTSEAR